jgi:hypothetical protein
MPRPLLYSTNVLLKYLIQKKYQNDVHYVWCSEHFDSSKGPAYAIEALIPPSSNPVDIYRALNRAVAGRDRHDAKIAEQKASLLSLAVKWEQEGSISAQARDDITVFVKTAGFEMWRPVIYLIPRAAVEDRLMVVPAEKRAGFGTEYIVADLHGDEFDIIEV